MTMTESHWIHTFIAFVEAFTKKKTVCQANGDGDADIVVVVSLSVNSLFIYSNTCDALGSSKNESFSYERKSKKDKIW